MSILAIKGGEPVRKKLFPPYKVIGEEEKKEVMRVMDSGILSRYLGCWHQDFYGGPEVQAFEKEWALYYGVKHAVAVNSATSGLQAAVGALGISPGDEVIVSPYTMSADISAILLYGAIPVFADIESEYFCLDPKSVRERISPATKAIMITDIFGMPYNVEEINAIAREYSIPVIEDCAQAPGAMYRGKYAGTLGDVGIFSLNYHKHIHTGEGGIVVTNDDQVAERLRLIRNHAEAVIEDKGEKDIVNMIGFNFRLTEMQAAIGRVQLRKLKRLLEDRISNCNYLAEKLSALPGIKSPPVRPGATHAYYIQPFLFDENIVGVDRNTFIDAVKAELPATEMRELEGQQIGVGYMKPLYLLPLFQKRIAFGKSGYPFTLIQKSSFVSYKKGICPVVERLFEKELFTHEFMRPPATQADLDDVVKAFVKVYEHKNELKS